MSNVDGSVIIATDLDNKELEKKLRKLTNDIEKMEASVAKTQRTREAANTDGIFKAAKLDEEKAKLAEMRKELLEMRSISRDKAFAPNVREEARAAIPDVQTAVSDQATRVRMLQAEYDRSLRAVDSCDKKLRETTLDLEKAKQEAGDLARQLSESSRHSGALDAAAKKAQKSMQRLSLRMQEILRSALIFTLASQSLATFRDWMGKVVTANADAAASISRLKGAFLTMVQPILNVVIPAFVTLVNVLTAIIGRVSQLISALFGTTTEKAAEAAKAINAQVEALEATGKAAKKADKSLAAFDKLNKLSAPASQSGGQTSTGGATSIGEIKPDFAWSDSLSERLKKIADDVLLIGAGFALWKISDKLPNGLSFIGAKLGWLVMLIGSLLMYWDNLSDAFENGVDWGNFTGMIVGAGGALYALYKLCGPLAAKIGLVVAGIGMLVAGFKDIMDNGLDLENTLTTITGIMSLGLGISLLVGNFIPMLIAALLSVGLMFVELTGNGEQMVANLKQIFSGFTRFIDGLINGDIDQMIEGLKDMVKGAVNLILTLVGSLVNAIIKGLNWLIDKINSITFSIPEWVPGVGGKSFSPDLAHVTAWEIPQLAKGAVIPPNREFMAVLGDQTNGRNLEAPEGLIRQIVREESGGGMNTELLQAILNAIREGKVLVVDGVQFGKLVYSANKAESRRVGVSLSG